MKQITSEGRQKGFTLLDTVVYIGLFSLVTSFVIVILYQIIAGQGQHRNRVEVDAESNFMMQKIVWALTGAQTINQPAVNATSSVLSVSKYGFSENPLVFDVGSRNLRLTRGSGTPALLGNNRVYVGELLFEHLPSSLNAAEAVRVTLTVDSSDITRPTASTTLTNTIYLRK
jgi:type II secretory pathway component PulJ